MLNWRLSTLWAAVGERDPTVEPPEVLLFPLELVVDVVEVVDVLDFPCANRGRTSREAMAGGTKAAVFARRSRNARRVSSDSPLMISSYATPDKLYRFKRLARIILVLAVGAARTSNLPPGSAVQTCRPHIC